MKIAVNARFLLKDRLEGIGRFSHETLKRMTRNHPEHDFIFYFDRAYDPSFIYSDNVLPVIAHPQARHPYLYYLWFEWSLPYFFRKHKPDLFLSPDGFLSLKAGIPSVPVMHDLAFEHYPQYVSKTGAKFYKKNFPEYARRAVRIATVSEFSKRDISSLYGINPGKIDVVYNGAASFFSPLPESAIREQRLKVSKGNPYWIYVGALHPRKNIGRLLEAFDLFKETDEDGFFLIIAGRKAWQTEDLEGAYANMKFRDSVIFTGRISDEELAAYIAGAYALTYIPVFEGFGLPLLEAFRCHVPAITSSVSSLPEVGAEGALYCDPFSAVSISTKMTELARNKNLYQKLRATAKTRGNDFSWEKTADLLWKTIENALEASRSV
jgi:glycosyltransferase involved in cell wall biosynthesis